VVTCKLANVLVSCSWSRLSRYFYLIKL